MNLTLSPQIKILGLVGLLAAIGLMASMTVLGGSSSPSNSDTTITRAPRRHTATVTTPATKAHTPTKKPSAAKTHPTTTPAKSATKPKTHVVRHVAPKVQGNKVYGMLPAALQWELSQHDVVVVSLYNPNSEVDSISVNEAHAGAADASVGYLLVNVLDDAVAGRLTALLPGGGLLPDPGVLVYRAPGNIAFRFDGFVDRATVAQAAANAASGETGPATAVTAG